MKYVKFFYFLSKWYPLPDLLPLNLQDCHELLQGFFSSCDLPKLTREALDSLNAPITAEEIKEVLKMLPSGKSLGPDNYLL